MITSPALAGVRHGFFTREGGHSTGVYAGLNCGYGSGDDRAVVARNRAEAAARLGVAAERLLTAWQWHSADVLVADAPWDAGGPPRGDAMVTATPGLGLGILTADCGPLLLADRTGPVVGAAHAGWQGALNGIGEATIAAMEALGADRRSITAVLGPTISQAAYEVGPEFLERFVEHDRGNRRFFRAAERPHHQHFDLPGYIMARLAAAGIGQAVNLGLCTYGEARCFYSYRRSIHAAEEHYGRLISVISI